MFLDKRKKEFFQAFGVFECFKKNIKTKFVPIIIHKKTLVKVIYLDDKYIKLKNIYILLISGAILNKRIL